jgi:small subunit ribosomal protein S3Ae
MAKKLKGKEWYNILAPPIFKEKVIGETPTSDIKSLVGRTVDVNLINLITDMSKYYMKFFLKVKEVKEKNAYTEFVGMECMRDYISRSIRYGIRRVDTVQDMVTKDGKKIRVKSIIITSKKIKKNVEINLKKFIEDYLKKDIESKKLDEIIERIINDNMKNHVFEEGNKIYPIRTFEIRKIQVLSQ